MDGPIALALVALRKNKKSEKKGESGPKLSILILLKEKKMLDTVCSALAEKNKPEKY